MQWSLVLLVLMGQGSLFTCELFEYHFINESKSWDAAQKYCRETHTDLVTMYEETDIMKIHQSAREQDAWTGLYNRPVSDPNEFNWRWSQPGVEYTKNTTAWCPGEPNNAGGGEYCVLLGAKSCVTDVPCAHSCPFICYNAEKSKKFHVIEERKTWLDAQTYCRKTHTDLVSGSQLKDEELIRKLPNNTDDHWIGLFADTWRWSDGSSSLFRPWNQTFPDNQPGNNTCAVLGKDGSWNTADCDSPKPFFCYRDNVILVKENKTWEEAINYCREKHTDLISITDAEQQRWVQERAKNASSSHVWLALRFTCILEVWFWVTNERVDYENWAPHVKMDDCNMSGAMETGGDHKWFKEDDMRKFNFFCT